MATIVSTLFLSLDGVAEIDPAWHFPYFDENMGAAVGADYEGVDVLLLGRVTYDSFAGAWPDREAAGGDDAAFAGQLGDLRKLVATRREPGTDLGWRNVTATDDVVAAARELRADSSIGKVLVAGSISVVQQLLAAGVLDELRLLVHPVAAGHGEQLFPRSEEPVPLRLVSSQAFPTGVTQLVYSPAPFPGAAGYEDAVENLPS